MKQKILIIGPLPPPYFGVSVATQIILESELKNKFHLIHLDTSDHRPLSNIGKLDFRNIYLAILHIFKLFSLLLTSNSILPTPYCLRLVYLPISQGSLGYLRDGIFIILGKFFNKKVIIHLRGGYFRKFYKKSNFLMKSLIYYTIKNTSRAIVQCLSLTYIFEKWVSPDEIKIVPNGIALETFSNPKIHINRKSRNNYKILFVGNLQETKGFTNIIKAADTVLNIFPSTQFLFAGSWRSDKLKTETEKLIRDLNIESAIKFLGSVYGTKKIRLYLNSNIFVFPTYYPYEGFPWVVLEAMAAGLPVISTDQGCIKEMVRDGYNGFIVPKKNPQAIAEKIILLLKNERMRKLMGQRSRKLVEERYTTTHFINGLADVFTEVLSTP